jgi:alkylated DNA nucleotide flippase Atl1
MTLEQRAQQFWSVLVLAAREQKVLSRRMLAQLTGFPDESRSVMYYIHCYCKRHNLPSLNVIVIDPATGRPGDVCDRDLRDTAAQQLRVFLYDWLNQPAPSEEMFKHAVEQEEEIDRANLEYVALPC